MNLPTSPVVSPVEPRQSGPAELERGNVMTTQKAAKKAATKKGASKKASAKKAPKAEPVTRNVGPSKQALAVLKAIKALGGKNVPKAKIVTRCAKADMTEAHVGHQLYHARNAATPLVTRKVHEDGTMEFTLTAAGAKALGNA